MNLVEEIKKGNVENVKHLIDAGADINSRNHSGNTALIGAARSGHIEVVKMLIEAGADLNVVGNYDGTALMWAAYKKHSEVVKLLIDAGAKNDNLDAMIEARKKEREEHIKLFKKGI